jgi:hypothetical protein
MIKKGNIEDRCSSELCEKCISYIHTTGAKLFIILTFSLLLGRSISVCCHAIARRFVIVGVIVGGVVIGGSNENEDGMLWWCREDSMPRIVVLARYGMPVDIPPQMGDCNERVCKERSSEEDILVLC